MGSHTYNEDFDPTGTATKPTGDPGAPGIWRDVVADLRKRVTVDDYQRFIHDLRLIAEIDGDIVVAARSKYAHDCVDAEHRRMIQRLWRRKDPRERGVRLVCWANEAKKFADIVEDPWAEAAQHGRDGADIDAGSDMSSAPVSDRAYATFETLVTGESNTCAAGLMRHIADGGDLPARVVLLYGLQGTGKTHMLSALQNAVARSGLRKAVYMTAEEFKTDYVSGAIERDTRALKSRVRSGDLLLIDDLHWIANAPGTDREFFASLRAVTSNGGLVILTADAAPNELKGFSPELQSELRGAASVEVGLPDEAMRREILRTHARLQRERAPNFVVGDDMVEEICRRVRGPGRELCGVLWSLYTACGLGAVEPTREMLDTVIRRQEGDPRPPTMETIKRAAMRFFSVSKSDLEGRSKARAVAYPRQVTMFLCRELTDKSYPQIGHAFGRRDHTTVMYADRKIGDMLARDPRVCQHVDQVRSLVYDIQAETTN